MLFCCSINSVWQTENGRSVAQFCGVLELVGRNKGGRGTDLCLSVGSVREVGDPRREGRESVSVTHSNVQLSILLQHMWRRVF